MDMSILTCEVFLSQNIYLTDIFFEDAKDRMNKDKDWEEVFLLAPSNFWKFFDRESDWIG